MNAHEPMRDYWMAQFYRQMAKVIHDPSADNERQMMELVKAYRTQCVPGIAAGDTRSAVRDPHEWVMDYV